MDNFTLKIHKRPLITITARSLANKLRTVANAVESGETKGKVYAATIRKEQIGQWEIDSPTSIPPGAANAVNSGAKAALEAAAETFNVVAPEAHYTSREVAELLKKTAATL